MRLICQVASLALGVLLCGVFALTAGKASAQVAGGKHDLSAFGGSALKYRTREICVFCHTPHNANQSAPFDTAGLLWNRTAAVTSFQLYTSATLDATPNQPGGISIMCLSCHDGIGSMNVLLNFPYDGVVVAGALDPMPGVIYNQFSDSPTFDGLNIGDFNGVTGGDDLRNDHPVGISYDLGGPELKPIPGAPFQFFGADNRIECSTCHDVHMTNVAGNKFLVMSNSGSALCLSCHDK